MAKLLLKWLVGILLCTTSCVASASEWQPIDLPSRPVNIAENNGVLWVCGADELIANSTDAGKTWTVAHSAKDAGVLLYIGFSNGHIGYATGTSGWLLLTADSGKTWERKKAPDQVIYSASFSDVDHGIVHSHAIYTTSDGGVNWTPVKIEAQNEDLKAFPYVSAVLELDAQHMIIVVSEGNSPANHQELLVTKDAGANWNLTDIPSTGLDDLSVRDGRYWFAGMEVIAKDKPGGGHGVSLLMTSTDGGTWTHITRWSPKEFDVCNAQGCLYWDGAGVKFPPSNPTEYWAFPAEKVITPKWAATADRICTVAAVLECASLKNTQTMPSHVESSSPISDPTFPPPLDAPTSKGLQCIFCESERYVVTPDFQGAAAADLRLQIGLNGLVEQVEVLHATNASIGDRLAAMARNWIFVPYVSDGVVHPVITSITVRTMALRSP